MMASNDRQIPAIPYLWPSDASLDLSNTALLLVNMQKDCKYKCSKSPR